MKNLTFSVSVCCHCSYYQPQGRRGGHCKQLCVAVKGKWKACSLAHPVFASAWNSQHAIAYEATHR
jgi:hypothetical protein